ncbi:hypothetical protein JMJ55_00665 [Belnapia sp. T6]|uniref:Uncharacterized protein n=1 Tax=Belnapia mucosa TaxID=2804532 RepID=A0ABS1UWG3_9PROT|nr:hypothetical protein [Belnapia mucosa]MBL6453811.1 hypothetical protein [Belnapia mucosa]
MMFRTLLLASVIGLGATGAVLAQEGPVLVGGNGGGGPEVVYPSVPTNNILGGAQVSISGGAQNRTYTYGAVNSFPAQAGTIVGGNAGGGPEVVYNLQPQASGLASLGVGAPRS